MTPEKSNYHSGSKNNECYFCGAGPPLREHHIIPQRFDGPDTKDNIVELCDLCHQRIERLYDKSFYEWFGIEDTTGKRKFHRQCENSDCTNRARVKIDCREVRWDYDLNMIAYEEGFRCRPCTAKLAKNIADTLHTKHNSEVAEFYDTLERIHKNARKARNQKYCSAGFVERLGKNLTKPQEPMPDAERIMDKITIEKTDE